VIDLSDIRPEAGELVVVVGPTASGKSDLAMALAERLDGEIIGADSVQVYRAFDIGTGKPSPDDRARIPHHLVDVIDPLEHFDAARFVELADRAIAEIQERGRVPIVCGGTFLWVRALLFGLAPMPPADPEVRARHQAEADRVGRAALHERLTSVDPAAAERLAPNDLVRVSRALEVFELTGKTLTAWHEEHRFEEERYRARLLGVARDRDELDRRIRTRTRGWLEAGWVDQVRALRARGLDGARAMDAVGFRQVRDHLDGDIPAAELEDAIVRATRKFVRRQRTWLRDEPVAWLDPSSLDQTHS
jgi:tRNA dimethylallyltransferase